MSCEPHLHTFVPKVGFYFAKGCYLEAMRHALEMWSDPLLDHLLFEEADWPNPARPLSNRSLDCSSLLGWAPHSIRENRLRAGVSTPRSVRLWKSERLHPPLSEPPQPIFSTHLSVVRPFLAFLARFDRTRHWRARRLNQSLRLISGPSSEQHSRGFQCLPPWSALLLSPALNLTLPHSWWSSNQKNFACFAGWWVDRQDCDCSPWIGVLPSLSRLLSAFTLFCTNSSVDSCWNSGYQRHSIGIELSQILCIREGVTSLDVAPHIAPKTSS